MTISLAAAHYQMVSSTVVPDALAENLFSASGGQSALHFNLQGLLANDASYVTNEFLDNELIRGTSFKVDDLPDGFTNVILKARWKFTNCFTAFARTSNFEISLHQGNVVHSPLVELDLSGQLASLGYTCDVWNDLVLPVSSVLITDRTDLYIRVYMDRVSSDSEFSSQRVSWLAIEASFPFGSGESPSSKNYVTGLLPISPAPSVGAFGTTGSSTYCYRVIPGNAAGFGPYSDEIIITDGNATLDATNYNCITWLEVEGATQYRIYRTCSPSGLGLGLLATVTVEEGDCSGGGGSGVFGFKDDGTQCVTDCEDIFSPGNFVGCQGETTVTYPAKETPS